VEPVTNVEGKKRYCDIVDPLFDVCMHSSFGGTHGKSSFRFQVKLKSKAETNAAILGEEKQAVTGYRLVKL